MKIDSERGAVRLIMAIIKNTFQAIEHPRIIGKKTVRSQERWYRNLIKWAKEEEILMSFWSEAAEEDDGRVRLLIIKKAKSKLRKLKRLNKPL